MEIKDKCALVTGGSSGIGYLCVKELLRNGAKCVIILDINHSEGSNAVKRLAEEFGTGRGIFLPCDVTNEAELRANFQTAVRMCQGLDIVVNNAGLLDEKRWELMIDVNYKSLVRGTLLGMEYMGKHEGGRGGTVLNVASITGLKTIEEMPIYSGTKSAVIGFCNGVKDLYDKTGVRILTICPGVTNTTLINELSKKLLDLVEGKKIEALLTKYPTQPPEVVAESMVELLKKGKNGAVWVVEGNEPPYAVEMLHYSSCRVPL